MKDVEKNNYLIYIFLFVLFIAVFGLFYRVIQLENQVVKSLAPFQLPQGLNVGMRAPDFSLPDLDGSEKTLSDLVNDGNILLVFSSTTCSACQDFWPSLKEFANNNPKLNIVMISEGSLDDELQMKNQEGFNFLILQADQNILNEYKVPGTPYLYLLDKNMEIVLAGFSNQMGEIQKIIK